MIGEGTNKKKFLFKDFNLFMYDHTLYCRRKHFCRYCLQLLIELKYSKFMLITALKSMLNKLLRCLKNKHVRFKNYERKTKSSFNIFG